MKVGLVIYGSLDTLSGGYLYDRKLVEYLRAQGDTVEIVSQPWGSYAARLAQSFQPGWGRRLADLDVDVLLEDELNHPSLFLANRALKSRVNYPVLSVTHHLRSSESHPKLLRWLYKIIERRFLAGVDGFIWNSRTTQQAVEKLLGHNITGVVAYPAGDLLGGLGADEIEARCREEGLLRILFVGNLAPRKGLHTLFGALASLKSDRWLLKIVGDEKTDTAYSNELRRWVSKLGLAQNILFLGKLPEGELVRELRSAQLMVMVSQYEGFGIVYLEGMSFGLPAIASTAGGAGEIIQDGINGWLVPPGDAAALSDAIRYYIEDRTRLREHSLAARRRFLEFPGWQQTTASIREFIACFVDAWKGKAA